MINIHQVLHGARTRGTIKTYINPEYIIPPTASLSGTALTLEGQVEFDGFPFDLTDFDLANVDSMLSDGEYIVSAVPGYLEPLDKAEAESNNVNYFIQSSTEGESLLRYFIPSSIENKIKEAGGYTHLLKRRSMGVATPLEVQLLNRYSDQLERLSDPRYVGRLLEPSKVEYVITKVYDQDNRSRDDILIGKSNEELRLFMSTQGYVPSELYVMSIGDAASVYDSLLAKVNRVFAYESEEDAEAQVGGVEIRLDYKEGDTIANAVDLDGDTIDQSTYTHVALYEYYLPTYMPRGHEGLSYGKRMTYTKQDSTFLGRVNPIYLDRALVIARNSAGRAMPLSQMTQYGYPLPIAKVVKENGSYSSATPYITGSVRTSSGGHLDDNVFADNPIVP